MRNGYESLRNVCVTVLAMLNVFIWGMVLFGGGG